MTKTSPISCGHVVRLAAAWIALLLGACGTQDHRNVFHATFEADGAAKDYRTQIGFLDLFGDYGITYMLDPTDPSPSAASLGVTLPEDVRAGATYTAAGPHVNLAFQDGAGHFFHARQPGATLRLTVETWDGKGGYAAGTFAADLRDDDGRPATLTSGTFEGFIH